MVAEGFIRLYEGFSALLVVIGLIYVIRRRNPLYYGLYLGSAVGGGVFEWIFDTRWYFNLTADERLIPLWWVGDAVAPLAMVFFYTFFFGIPLILLVEHSGRLFGRLGRRGGFALVVLGAIVGVQLFEGFNTSVIRVYEYHQAEHFLSWGMPWSNLWFSPLIFTFAFWGALRVRDVLDMISAAKRRSPAQCEVVGSAADTGTAIALGFAVLVTSYFTAFTLNGIWYLLAQPWVESGRPF